MDVADHPTRDYRAKTLSPGSRMMQHLSTPAHRAMTAAAVTSVSVDLENQNKGISDTSLHLQIDLDKVNIDIFRAV